MALTSAVQCDAPLNLLGQGQINAVMIFSKKQARSGRDRRRIDMLSSSTALAAILVVGSLVFAASSTTTTIPTASATFPGVNGKIAFVSDKEGVENIYVMNSDGSGRTRLTNNLANDANPSWSPDGSKITFVSDRDGNNEIYVMNSDGSGQRRLTDYPGYDSSPSWSPDGKEIMFTRSVLSHSEVYIMNSNGSSPISLTNDLPDDAVNPRWSPDGRKIVFVDSPIGSGGLDDAIYVMNADGTGKTLVTRPVFFLTPNPSWSPDGQKIAFERMSFGERDATHDIYVINSDGTNLTRLTKTPIPGGSSVLNADRNPTWSPDGTKIAFESNRDGNGEVYVMNPDGTEQINVSNNSTSEDGSPVWSPDGTKLVFLRNGIVYVANPDGTAQVGIKDASVKGGESPDWGVSAEAEILTITTSNISGNPLIGLWTTIHNMDGTLLESGFTPMTFTGSAGTDYKVSVANYDGKTFQHWQDDNNNTSKSRIITLASDTTLIAVYDTGNALRGFTPLRYADTAHQRNLNISAMNLDTNEILHMWVVIDPISSDASGTTYRVYATNGYKNLTFDHWADGSTDRVKTITVAGDGPSITGTTAFYHTG